jgi:hypothetical protein
MTIKIKDQVFAGVTPKINVVAAAIATVESCTA